MEMVSITFSGRRIGHGDPPPALGAPLVGREDDVQQLGDLLDQQHVRLVTLTGPAGVGKTRLAYEAASRLGARFAEGVVCVRLETALDEAAVPREVARALGLRENMKLRAPNLLADTLSGAHLLLVLDGFEHVTGSQVWLHELLLAAPRIKVLVTSRVPLGAPDEREYQVPPLSSAASTDLFLRLATGIEPRFSPDEASIEIIGEICQEVGNLPLNIELAAAWMKDMAPAALLAYLNVGPEPAAKRGSPGWSYGLLNRPEQMLLCRLAIFSAGFSEDAAMFVACWPDAPTGAAHLESLTLLADHQIVNRVPGPEPSLFQMHAAIRTLDQCRDIVHGDDLAPVAFAEYYRSLGAQAEEGLVGPEQVRWLNLLDREYPNIQHAVTWLEANDRVHHAVELLSQIQYFISIRGHTLETLDRMVRWLDATMLVPWSPEHGLAQLTLGRLYQNTGQFELSIRMLTEAAATCVANGDLRHAAMAKTLVAADYALMGLTDEVSVLASEALELALPLGMHRFVAAAMSWQAWHAEATGDQARADALRNEVREIAAATVDRWAMSFGLAPRANASIEAGEYEEAERLATELRDILADIGSLHDLPAAYHLLARVAEARGDLDAAMSHLQEAVSFADACGNRQSASVLVVHAANLALRREQLAEAADCLAGAIVRQEAEGVTGMSVNGILSACADLALRHDDRSASARFLGASSGADMALLQERESLADTLCQVMGRDDFQHEFATGSAWDAGKALAAARSFLGSTHDAGSNPFP